MFYKDKLILVTGGTGFVGSNFMEELIKKGAKLRVPIHNRKLLVHSDKIEQVENIDFTKTADCDKVMQGVDYVIHLAGAVGNPATVNNGLQIYLDNIVLTANIAQAAWGAGVKRFLYCSSSTGYPDRRYAIKEEEYWDEDPHSSYYGYGHMRRYMEKILDFVSRQSSMEVALVRATGVYGPYDNFNLKTCHVIPALISKALNNAGSKLEVWGTGDVVRDFLYIKDFVKGSLMVFEHAKSMDPINIGYGSTVTIDEIVKAILKATGKENLEIEYNSSKPTTIPFRMVDTTKAQQLLGFKPQYSLEEGMKETVEWYKKFLINN